MKAREEISQKSIKENYDGKKRKGENVKADVVSALYL
jgi:hypothetical protein